MGIGVDIVYIPRLENKDDLAKRILSSEEYKLYELKTNKAEFLAGRFATKEAFVKAHHGTIKDLNFKEISVTYDVNNAPIMMFRGKQYEVSISHDGDYAIAVVLSKDE